MPESKEVHAHTKLHRLCKGHIQIVLRLPDCIKAPSRGELTLNTSGPIKMLLVSVDYNLLNNANVVKMVKKFIPK